MDNAPAHTAKGVLIPDNVSLLFQPPHCPDTNPIERVWQWIKKSIKGLNFPSLMQLKLFVWESIQQTSHERFCSLTYWPHIKEAIRTFRSEYI